MIGRTLGRYRVDALIGEGGMGVVYKAYDTHLDRPVALKVLKPAPGVDRERQWRFAQEAKAASALNHPHIIHVYDVARADEVDFIAMEYVAGHTLDRLIGAKGLPWPDAVRYGAQIAEALAAAHAAGIVHRDIKPSNIIVTDHAGRTQGVVKLLDFGVAKLTEPAPADTLDATHTQAPKTIEGAIVGTVSYMSPEQANGAAADARSDVFSFGAVLYEMITGRRAFDSGSAMATVSAILHHEPTPIQQLVGNLPPELASVVARCLRKNPKRRFQVIDDVRIALEDILEQPPPSTLAVTGRRPPSGWVRWVAGMAALSVALVLSAFLMGPLQLDTSAHRYLPLVAEPAAERDPAWSPDGKVIAYVAEVDGINQIFTRSVDATASTQVTSATEDCSSPFWSPDGASIYYTFGIELWSVGATGGEPRRVIADAPFATVAPDGKTFAILRGLGGNRAVWITPPAGGEPQQYRTAPFPETFTLSTDLEFSRDGTELAVLIEPRASTAFASELWILPVPSGVPKRVLERAPYNPTGGRLSWLADGRHILLTGGFSDRPGNHLYLADVKNGSIHPLTSGAGDEDRPAVSPSQDRIAFTSGSEDFDLIQIQLDGSVVHPLLASSRDERWPAWAPDGRQIAYVTNARGTTEIWLRSLRETWTTPVVTRQAIELGEWQNLARPSLSPDGQRVAYEVVGATHTIWISSIAGGRAVRLDSESTDQHSPSWSPDGKWIAYQRLHEAKWELAKMPLGGGTAVRLGDGNAGGGPQTAWSPDGQWIAYVSRGTLRLISADGQTEKAFVSAASPAFGFSRDSRQFYVLRRAPDRSWELARFETGMSTKQHIIRLNLPRSAALTGFSLHPDGASFATSMGIPNYDIWLLDGFKPPSRWRRFF